VCVVRYGGFGDMIQTAGILPALKRDGYHVTVMTTPKGQDILKHDPHVDAWIIQDDNQVPNHELADFWAQMAKRFDKLREPVRVHRGHAAGDPGPRQPPLARRTCAASDGRELPRVHRRIGGVPFEPDARFYPTIDEAAQTHRYLVARQGRVAADRAQAKARNAAQKIMGLRPSGAIADVPIITPVFNIMWCLPGQLVHKAYPHMDAVIAASCWRCPRRRSTSPGDAACQILEAGWENEPRVFRQSGEMSIRQTLALAQACDLVIGPETGVLNAVAFENNTRW
jgi:hypothetical protein